MKIVSALLLDILTLKNKKVSAMALWPFMIFRDGKSRRDPRIINHERIHFRQQTEWLILPFYLLYFTEYWMAMFRNGFRHWDAYHSVSFEKEAYAHEKDADYLKKRKFMASLQYITAKRKENDRGKKNNR